MTLQLPVSTAHTDNKMILYNAEELSIYTLHSSLYLHLNTLQ